VEVKNVHDDNPNAAPRLEPDYLRALLAYGELFSRRVCLAIYWSNWRQWTLHDVSRLAADLDAGITLWFGEAFRRSEMRLLGDALLGTKYPLTVRFGVTSELKDRQGSESQYLLRIDSVDVSVAGKPINNERDHRIAYGLMVSGGWEETERVEMDGDRVIAIEFSYAPREVDNPDLGFHPVASLSSLASTEFNDLTVDSDAVERLRPQALPSPPYPRVGEKYNGVDLPLWVMILQPDESLLKQPNDATVEEANK
jgi:hypothetical protein